MACSSCNKTERGPLVRPMPGLGTQLANAGAAIYRAAGAALTAAPVTAKPETIAHRKAICFGGTAGVSPASSGSVPAPSSCEHCIPLMKSNRIYHRCSQCGCWLDGKFFAKLKLATESCPLGKWRDERFATGAASESPISTPKLPNSNTP